MSEFDPFRNALTEQVLRYEEYFQIFKIEMKLIEKCLLESKEARINFLFKYLPANLEHYGNIIKARFDGYLYQLNNQWLWQPRRIKGESDLIDFFICQACWVTTLNAIEIAKNVVETNYRENRDEIDLPDNPAIIAFAHFRSMPEAFAMLLKHPDQDLKERALVVYSGWVSVNLKIGLDGLIERLMDAEPETDLKLSLIQHLPAAAYIASSDPNNSEVFDKALFTKSDAEYRKILKLNDDLPRKLTPIQKIRKSLLEFLEEPPEAKRTRKNATPGRKRRRQRVSLESAFQKPLSSNEMPGGGSVGALSIEALRDQDMEALLNQDEIEGLNLKLDELLSKADLPPQQRLVFDLKRRGFTNLEIAEKLKIDAGTVRVHIHYACSKLKRAAKLG